jgi:hypothetical protein
MPNNRRSGTIQISTGPTLHSGIPWRELKRRIQEVAFENLLRNGVNPEAPGFKWTYSFVDYGRRINFVWRFEEPRSDPSWTEIAAYFRAAMEDRRMEQQDVAQEMAASRDEEIYAFATSYNPHHRYDTNRTTTIANTSAFLSNYGRSVEIAGTNKNIPLEERE